MSGHVGRPEGRRTGRALLSEAAGQGCWPATSWWREGGREEGQSESDGSRAELWQLRHLEPGVVLVETAGGSAGAPLVRVRQVSSQSSRIDAGYSNDMRRRYRHYTMCLARGGWEALASPASRGMRWSSRPLIQPYATLQPPFSHRHCPPYTCTAIQLYMHRYTCTAIHMHRYPHAHAGR